MIEPMMFFGLGFLSASLIALIVVPSVHNRAVRLTRRRLETEIPLSIAEVLADKDFQRAEFAISTRRLEIRLEQLKVRTANYLAELANKAAAINRLKGELAEKTVVIAALTAREKSRQDQVLATKSESWIKTNSIQDAERALADKVARIVTLSADLSARSLTARSPLIEPHWMRMEPHRDVPSPPIVPVPDSPSDKSAPGASFGKKARQPGDLQVRERPSRERTAS